MYQGRTFIRESVYVCGNYMDADIYPVFQKPGRRRSRCKPTSEIQRRLNQKNAEKRLTRLVHTNFTEDDIALHLTYRPGEEPETKEGAQRDLQNYIRRLKRRYTKLGKEFKYISCTEYGKKTNRIHHHLIINGGLDRDEIEKLWGRGYANSIRLQFGPDGVTGLAHYIAKDKLFFRHWNQSRNLVQPEPAQYDGKITMDEVGSLVDAIEEKNAWVQLEQRYPEYQLTSISYVRNAVNKGVYIHFEMRRRWGRYPCFFKEEHIYKVYGDKPSNFQVMGSASLGVEAGSDASVAIAGETLFYLARTGIVAYSGGIPQQVGAAFGTQRFRNAVGGSDGTKYYVSMKDTAGAWHLFVYDTLRGLWHREDALEVVGWGWNGELYFLAADGRLLLNGNARTAQAAAVRETEVSWMTEWADFYEYTTYSSASVPIPQKKGIGKLLVRLELDEGASVKIEMQFDSDGVWREVKTLQAEKKRSFYLPIVPRRCDHFRIRMTGSGGCRLYSLVREVYTGSEL